MTNIAKAAEVIDGYLQQHILTRDTGSPLDLARSLADAGLLASDPPPPDYNEDGKHIWLEGSFSIASGGDPFPGTVAIQDSEPGGVLYTAPADARAMADALYAAADHAQKDNNHD